MERTILHSDINSCYAAIECSLRPELKGLPVAVGGDAKKRHGIILAKNELARRAGVRTAEPLWQAREKCPGLVILPPNFPLYTHYAEMVRSIYADYTPQQEPFGLDESWLDVSGSYRGGGEAIAGEIRERVRRELGITVSVGVSWNKVFAKLGSDLKKPDAVTVINRENYRDVVWPRPAGELLFVGPATGRKLERAGIHTIGQIAGARPEHLYGLLGKMGVTLHNFAAGRDMSPVRRAGERDPVKSVGNSTTTPRDMETDEDVKITLYALCDRVAFRLRENGLRCRAVQLQLRDTRLHSFERQCPLDRPTAIATELFDHAMGLFRRHYPWPRPLRSIGIRAIDLVEADGVIQLSLFPEDQRREKRERLETVMDQAKKRFGPKGLRRGIVLADRDLGESPSREDVPHFWEGV